MINQEVNQQVNQQVNEEAIYEQAYELIKKTYEASEGPSKEHKAFVNKLALNVAKAELGLAMLSNGLDLEEKDIEKVIINIIGRLELDLDYENDYKFLIFALGYVASNIGTDISFHSDSLYELYINFDNCIANHIERLLEIYELLEKPVEWEIEEKIF